MRARSVKTGAANLTIVFWRDIPAEILVRRGRDRSRGELGARFAAAIDMAAMNGNARDSDAYLAGWRRSDPRPITGDPADAARAAADEIEVTYPAERLRLLVNNGGNENAV